MRVAIAIDGTTASNEAIEQALEFSEELSDPLDIDLIHCVVPRVTLSEPTYESGTQQAEEEGEQILENAKEIIEKSNKNIGSVSTSLVYSEDGVVEAILDYLSVEELDMIFTGHRDVSGKTERFVGSTTKNLISQSPVPVIAV